VYTTQHFHQYFFNTLCYLKQVKGNDEYLRWVRRRAAVMAYTKDTTSSGAQVYERLMELVPSMLLGMYTRKRESVCMSPADACAFV